MQEVNDIKLAIKGNKEAYGRLINENKYYFYSIAIGILRNEEDAKDALGSMMIIGYQNIKKLKHDEYFKTWATRILINECKKLMKKNKTVVNIDDYIETSESMQVISVDDKVDISNAINSLKPEDRALIIMFYYEDLKIEEISKILKIPEGTVKSRIHRIKQELAKYLRKEDVV